MQDEKHDACIFAQHKMETHTQFWVLMEDKTDRPMLQLDDGRMAYTDR